MKHAHEKPAGQFTRGQQILLGVLLLAAAVSVGYLAFYYMRLHNADRIYQTLQSSAVALSAQPTPEPAASEPPQPTAEPVVIPIDFDELHRINPDIYAWLEIPGTDIAYPIAQHPLDDSYYLDHTIEGVAGLPGSIYTERANAQDFSDYNTVIYGHNMKNGTMFGSLKKYRDPDYLQQHREIIIYTPTEKRVYRVFAAVVYSNIHILNSFDFTDSFGRKLFLSSLNDTRNLNSQVLDDVEVTTDSQLLTLSTCVGGQPNNRYLIEAVYVGDE